MIQRVLTFALFGFVALALTACGTETVTETVEVDAPRVVIDGSYSVAIGDTVTLTADTVNGEDSGYAWASLDSEIATIDEAGVVTGVAAGEVMITATGADSALVGTRGVVVVGEVVDVPDATATVDISGGYSLMPGETLTLTATTTNGEDSGYTWMSSDELVATVDGGVVTAVADGEVTITATGMDTAASATHGVVVHSAPMVVDPVVFVAGDFLVEAGGTVTLTATTMYGEDASYTWMSSDETIATVDDAGVVTGVIPGEVVITATGADTGVAGMLGVAVMEPPDDTVIPMWETWAASPHADKTADAFTHWDDDGEISTSCAKCHSQDGYLDYLGADGSTPWVVDAAAPTGTTVTCLTCHNAAAVNLFTVTFPSGVTVSDLGSEARCMTCHQGRESGLSVDDKLVEIGSPGDDDVSADLSFINVHYKAAGATLYGGIAKGGYQYDGMMYDTKNHHAAGLENCVSCHDQHSTEVRLETCADCHGGVVTADDVKGIRMFGSVGDYDGDADTAEGIFFELEGLASSLFGVIQTYAADVVGTGIIYDSHAYPYFFADTDGDGEIDEDEVNYGNKYATWTPRLLRAAYNYQYYLKDTGAYAHNPKYVIQLMHDSINDLNMGLDTPVAFAGERYDGAHFKGSSEAYRHWDEDENVSASCSKCHTAEGFIFFHDNGVTAAMPPENGMKCSGCHTNPGEWEQIRSVDAVEYPSGITITDAGSNDNLCATCHSGRSAKLTVDSAIANDSLGFKNVHYLPAAAVLNGTDAKVGYEYDGMIYAGKWTHTGGNSCTGCHSPKKTQHSFDIHDNQDQCFTCHATADDLHDIRMTSTEDYDGDGSSSESLMAEVEGLAEVLYAKIQMVAAASGNPIIYGDAYPYFFKDTNGDGVSDPGEVNYGNKYAGWTEGLMKSCFNYQVYKKEHGAWAHNFAYIGQLLYDSIMDMDPTVTGLTRP